MAGSVGLGQTLRSPSPTPALGLSCPLLRAQTFLTLPSPPSASVGAESVFGAHIPARLQARKCQAGPWPPHPVICSFPGLIMGWRGLCPPSPPPRRAGTAPAPQAWRTRKSRGCFSEGHPGNLCSQPGVNNPMGGAGQLGAGGGAVGASRARPHPPSPPSPHGISSLRLCLVSVRVVLSCPPVLDARPVSPSSLPGPHPAIALDPRPSCGAAKAPRMGPSRCCSTSSRTCR